MGILWFVIYPMGGPMLPDFAEPQLFCAGKHKILAGSGYRIGICDLFFLLFGFLGMLHLLWAGRKVIGFAWTL